MNSFWWFVLGVIVGPFVWVVGDTVVAILGNAWKAYKAQRLP